MTCKVMICRFEPRLVIGTAPLESSNPPSLFDISVVSDVCFPLVPNRALEDLYLTRSIAMLEGVEVFVEKRTC